MDLLYISIISTNEFYNTFKSALIHNLWAKFMGNHTCNIKAGDILLTEGSILFLWKYVFQTGAIVLIRHGVKTIRHGVKTMSNLKNQ